MLYLRWADPNKGSVYFGATPSDGQRVRLVHICDSFTAFLQLLRNLDD
jgi:hypothetical protein